MLRSEIKYLRSEECTQVLSITNVVTLIIRLSVIIVIVLIVHFLECALYSHVADFALRSTSCEGS